MLDKDRLWVGLLLGIIIPLGIYTLFIEGMDLSGRYVSNEISEKFQLVLVAINAIVMRQFMIKRNQENTGKGIFIITFIGVIIHSLKYYTDIL